LFEYLEKLLNTKIDLITKDGVESIRISYIKEEIKRSIVYA
jgi:predicted nucleotidyltransferase